MWGFTEATKCAVNPSDLRRGKSMSTSRHWACPSGSTAFALLLLFTYFYSEVCENLIPDLLACSYGGSQCRDRSEDRGLAPGG
jgi:hypothetical protein